MPTLGDMRKLLANTLFSVRMFGAEEVFHTELKKRIQELGNTICKENGLPLELGSSLPDDTILGDESEPLFWDIKKFIGAEEAMNEHALSGLS